MINMTDIVLCKTCGQPEYYGEMRWLSGRTLCRDCYRSDYEHSTGKVYVWDDLDGPRPTMKEMEEKANDSN